MQHDFRAECFLGFQPAHEIGRVVERVPAVEIGDDEQRVTRNAPLAQCGSDEAAFLEGRGRCIVH